MLQSFLPFWSFLSLSLLKSLMQSLGKPELMSKLTILSTPLPTRDFNQRRFWATQVNRKWGFFNFNAAWLYNICIAKLLSSKRSNLPECFWQTNRPRMSISGWRASFKNLFALAPYIVETQNERYQAILWKGEHRWWENGNFRQHSSWNLRSCPAFSSYNPFPSFLLNEID